MTDYADIVQRLRELHRPISTPYGSDQCEECASVQYPCPTIRILGSKLACMELSEAGEVNKLYFVFIPAILNVYLVTHDEKYAQKQANILGGIVLGVDVMYAHYSQEYLDKHSQR